MLHIGPVPLRNSVLLAPMAGFADYPMRRMVWQLGGGLTVGEMVASQARLWNTRKSTQRRRDDGDAGPRVVQLAGSDPAQLAEAARAQVGEGAQIIDLNFGCPAKKVCNRAAGSALLGDVALVGRIVEAVARAVTVPVTAKIRTGLRPDLRNGCDVARMVEAAGGRSLVVHGRTRACRFLGRAEHATLRAIRACVRIPVFANGDILGSESMRSALAQSGADGVMIGRAAVGAPWLPGVLAGAQEPDRVRQRGIMLEHVESMHDFYGCAAYRLVRKHVAAYLRQLDLAVFLSAFNALEDNRAQLRFLQHICTREEIS
ncbi:MAG: tRNA dihydrouridine synthase DusB [Pseudomonadales bacterium]